MLRTEYAERQLDEHSSASQEVGEEVGAQPDMRSFSLDPQPAIKKEGSADSELLNVDPWQPPAMFITSRLTRNDTPTMLTAMSAEQLPGVLTTDADRAWNYQSKPLRLWQLVGQYAPYTISSSLSDPLPLGCPDYLRLARAESASRLLQRGAEQLTSDGMVFSGANIMVVPAEEFADAVNRLGFIRIGSDFAMEDKHLTVPKQQLTGPPSIYNPSVFGGCVIEGVWRLRERQGAPWSNDQTSYVSYALATSWPDGDGPGVPRFETMSADELLIFRETLHSYNSSRLPDPIKAAIRASGWYSRTAQNIYTKSTISQTRFPRALQNGASPGRTVVSDALSKMFETSIAILDDGDRFFSYRYGSLESCRVWRTH